jgi:hypothetical protein
MKKYAVDVVRSDSTTIVVEAENEDEAIVKAGEIANNIPRHKWGCHDDYEIDIYDELNELIRLGYKVEYEDGMEYLTV